MLLKQMVSRQPQTVFMHHLKDLYMMCYASRGRRIMVVTLGLRLEILQRVATFYAGMWFVAS